MLAALSSFAALPAGMVLDLSTVGVASAFFTSAALPVAAFPSFAASAVATLALALASLSSTLASWSFLSSAGGATTALASGFLGTLLSSLAIILPY